ncbi:MAG: hypothetical protein RL398_3157 [Planctomycetota bacterium]|jgi:hypothetical protein
MTEAQRSPVARAVWTAAAVSLLVTLVRLCGELQHWHPAVFGTGAGGDNSPLGITWLVLPFGFWFGRTLAKNGSRPASLGKTALFCLLGIGLTVGVFVLAVTQVADWQLRMLVLGGGTAACGLIALIAWPRMWMTLVAYGFLARLPVVVVQYLSIENGWDVHFAKGPPDAPPEMALELLTSAQVSFWPLAFTPLVGGLFAVLGAKTVRA